MNTPGKAKAMSGRGSSPFAPARLHSGSRRAFTLIELILVMTILTIAIAFTAPALANFFRGRSLDSEARRLLALTRQGQSRAVSEGVPMELWIDSKNNKIGLEAEPSYEPTDGKAVEFTVAPEMQLVILNVAPTALKNPVRQRRQSVLANPAGNPVLSRHPDLPVIRFLPDGSISEMSVETIGLTRQDGSSLWLVQSRNGMQYELRARTEQN